MYNDSAPPIESPAMARWLRSFVTRYAFSTCGITSSTTALANAGNHGSTHRAARPVGRAVAQRVHHDHRLRLALVDQVVENHVGRADVQPRAGLVAQPVQQVQHRVRLLAIRHRNSAECRRSSRDRRRRSPTYRSDGSRLPRGPSPGSQARRGPGTCTMLCPALPNDVLNSGLPGSVKCGAVDRQGCTCRCRA